jgi:hypothetical protein
MAHTTRTPSDVRSLDVRPAQNPSPVLISIARTDAVAVLRALTSGLGAPLDLDNCWHLLLLAMHRRAALRVAPSDRTDDAVGS